MKPEVADEMAVRLKGLLPRMTDEQVAYWAETFQRFDRTPAAAAVDEYVRTRDELSTPELLSLVRAKAGRAADPAAADRRDDAARRRHLAAVDAAIAGLTDAQLADAKAAVLADLRADWTRAKLAGRDPRRDVVLRGLIYERVAPAASEMEPSDGRQRDD